jgi:hypothetical protein
LGVLSLTNRSFVFFFFSFLIFALPPLHAAGLSEFYNNDVTIVYEDSLENAALQIADGYPAIRKDLETIFNSYL